MAKELGGSEGRGFEEFMKCDEKVEVKVGSPEGIEEGIQSTSTVIWDPFTVLPKEIYVKIFEKLDNPSDKQNFMNAHVKWYELFKAERVKFLFGKVFEGLSLLPEKTWTPTWTEDDRNLFGNLTIADEDISEEMVNDDEYQDEDPSIKERLWNANYENLTRLRLVCRDWDQSIQNYYQLHPDYFQFVFCEDKWRKTSKHLKNQYPDGYLIDGFEWWFEYATERLKTDLDKFRASHPPSKNPFLTRKVRIQIDGRRSDTDQQLQALFIQIHHLFETYGEHIWHLSIWYCADLSPEMYLEMVKWLKLMPELRTLQLEFEYDCDIDRLWETNEIISTIQTDLPKMKKLQSFHVSGFPHSAFNKLLEAMEALEKVEVADPPFQLEALKFPTTLTDLALKLQAKEYIIQLNSLEQFPFVRNLVINLEWIWVDSDLYFEGPQPTWETVWMALEEKFPAVEDLRLILPRANQNRRRCKLMKQSLNCRLNLKKLKRVSLTFPSLSSLDFLQEIKTLRELKIEVDLYSGGFKGSDGLVRRERIQFNRDFATMWESNIWQVFPHLRKLSIKDGSRRKDIHHLYEKGAKGQQLYNIIIK